MRRLYVAGQGQDMTYCTAPCFEAAKSILGEGCRRPDPDDVRLFWTLAKIDTLSAEAIREQFGVSRQTVDGWWRKAGGAGLPRRREFRQQDRALRIRTALRKTKSATASGVARAVGASLEEVREIAKSMKVPLRTWHRRPSDDELVEIAKGKTWPELAEAVGLRITTLRAYIYARPELSARIREVRASRRAQPRSIDPQKVKRLHLKGLSAYAISIKLGVEQMAVRYWIKRLALGGPREAATSDRRKAGPAVVSSNGGADVQS